MFYKRVYGKTIGKHKLLILLMEVIMLIGSCCNSENFQNLQMFNKNIFFKFFVNKNYYKKIYFIKL